TIGELVGFLFFLALFYEPVARLHGLNQMLQAARAAGERVFDILDFAAETSNPKRRETLPSSSVKADGIHFRLETASRSPSPLKGERPAAPKPREGGAGVRGQVAYDHVH